MLEVDLFADFVTQPAPTASSSESDSINKNNDYFLQQFWGEKHQGFDVLYHNMKHGQISIKSLQDYIRENALSEDTCSKNLTRIAKLTAGFSTAGTFAPMFESLKTVAEKLSSCHMDIVHKLHELTKDLGKYLEEQKVKHKQVKEEVLSTSNALQQLQNVTTSVQKHKEKYHQCCVETERLKRSSAAQKEIEKAESKAKKAQDEYRSVVSKYKTLRDDYEEKMTESAKKFQELEAVHLDRMRKILDSYILSFENGNVLMGQVYEEFRRQIGEKTTEALIKQYSESKGTGTNKPEPLIFEECDVESALARMDLPQTDGVVADSKSVPSSTTRISIPINLPFRRKKLPKSSKTSVSTVKETNSTESPDKDSGMRVDEEGYTIRPESPKDLLTNHRQDTSDSSDSDWDDMQTRKIHVKINPKDANTSSTTDSNLDTLNEITKSLTLSSPSLIRSRKSLQKEIETETNLEVPTDGTKTTTQQILDLFGNNNRAMSNSVVSPPVSNNFSAPSLDDVFGEKTTHSTDLQQSPSNLSLNNLFVMPSSKEAENESTIATKPVEVNLLNPSLSFSSPTSPLNDFSFTDSNQNDSHKGSTTGFTSPDSTSPQSSIGAFSTDNFLSSRDSSPLPQSHSDPIRIAVAFTETVNALFKGANGESCRAQVIGDVHISFPAANIRSFLSNPTPPQLAFNFKRASNIEMISPKQSFISVDLSQSTPQQRCIKFDTNSLTDFLKKLSAASPNASHYSVPVLSYQVDSQSGHDLVPLLVSSSWKCETNSTEINVNYKYNNASTATPLSNVFVSVPVNGGVTSAHSTPDASWNSAQNRLLWTLPSPISNVSTPATLQSRLSLSSGPSSSASLAFKFHSEGAILSGSELELIGSGYRVMVVVKKFTSEERCLLD